MGCGWQGQKTTGTHAHAGMVSSLRISARRPSPTSLDVSSTFMQILVEFGCVWREWIATERLHWTAVVHDGDPIARPSRLSILHMAGSPSHQSKDYMRQCFELPCQHCDASGSGWKQVLLWAQCSALFQVRGAPRPATKYMSSTNWRTDLLIRRLRWHPRHEHTLA